MTERSSGQVFLKYNALKTETICALNKARATNCKTKMKNKGDLSLDFFSFYIPNSFQD